MTYMNQKHEYNEKIFNIILFVFLLNSTLEWLMAIFTYRNSDEIIWDEGVSEIHNAKLTLLSLPFRVAFWIKAEKDNSILHLFYEITLKLTISRQ